MMKEPRPGRVKTRLGRDLGMVGAAWWFRHQTMSLIRRIQDARWRTVLAVTPDAAGAGGRIWPAYLPRWPQGPGDLGDRMGRIFRSLPPGPVVIVGADVPGITPAHIWRAFVALGSSQAVFGPAPDGGYWLIGLKRTGAVPGGLFKDVRWSTAYALTDTIATLGGHSISRVDILQDVDTVRDLAVAWRFKFPPYICDEEFSQRHMSARTRDWRPWRVIG